MLTTSLDPQLQLERILDANEKAYARWAHTPPSQPLDTIPFGDTTLEPWQEANARQVVAGALAGLGADSHTLELMLDALGLLPAKMPAPPADITGRRRQYGRCPFCRRSSIALRKNGRLVGHARIYGISVAKARCVGGGTLPIATRKATAA